MATRMTISSVIGLGEDVFPSSSPVLKNLKILGAFHTSVAELEFAKKNNNSNKILAELNKSISAGEKIFADDAQSTIKSAGEGAFDRFALNYFTSTLVCLLKVIAQKISNSCGYLEDADQSTEKDENVELIVKSLDNIASVELQFSFGADPSTYAKEFHTSLLYAFKSLLENVKLNWCNKHKTREEVLDLASGEFNAWINSQVESAVHVRAYLNYDQQVAQQGKILEEVKGVTTALGDWISPSVELAKRKQKAWTTYREYLSGLPDEKITMFDEKFGVRKVFVQPEATYRVAGTKSKHETDVHDVAAMLGTLLSNRTEGDDLILLCGGPGSGKSTFCRFLASELSRYELIHPIFLRLRRMEDTKAVIPFLEENLQREGVVNKIADLAEIPNVVLILDGFDELVMASRTRLREFFNALKEDLSSAPLRSAKVIVSGRDTLFPSGAGLPTGAHVVSLLPFDSGRVERWGKKWRSLHKTGKGKSFKPEEFVSKEGKGKRKKPAPLEHLVSWPLTLHLVARAHTSGSIEVDASKSHQIAKAILYRSIVADSALRQSEQSSGRGRLDANLMRKFVRAIAWEMYRKGKEALELTEGLPILREIFADADESTLAELSDVTIVNQPELTKGEETGFEFVHKSFSEYFVAEKIATSLEKVSFKAQEWGVDDPTWRMSVSEATGELAEHFAVRLFTAEVQEMLEPMLGDFQAFLENKSLVETDGDIPSVALNLNEKLERLEGLLLEYSKGNLLQVVRSKIPHSGVHASDLEAFANYAAGLFLVGGSLCGSLAEYGTHLSRPLKINPASFLRLVHIIQAGDVNIDRSFASRAFYTIDVGKLDIPDYFPPTQPVHLRGVKGLPDYLTRAVSSLETELFIRQLDAFLDQIFSDDGRRDKERYFSKSKIEYDLSHSFDYRHSGDSREYLGKVLGTDAMPRDRVRMRHLSHELLHRVDSLRHSTDEKDRQYAIERIFDDVRSLLRYQVEETGASMELMHQFERFLHHRFEPHIRR